MTIDDIQVSGTRATAAVLIDKKKAPNRYHFTKEKGSWKLDLTPTLRDTDLLLKAQIKKAGVSEDQFIFDLVEALSGRKVPESIWEPMKIK